MEGTLKVPRFMTEYANHKISKLSADTVIAENVKNEMIRNIDRAVFNYRYGYITIDEAMRIINNPIA